MKNLNWHLPGDLPEAFKARFWAKVRKDASCWIWMGAKTPEGYGRFVGRKWGLPKYLGAHRVAYELLVGPVPDDRHLDHLCRTPSCVNPAHLEPVTPQVNMRRATAHITHCPRGHAYDPDNRVKGEWRGRESCKTCMRERNRKRYWEKKVMNVA